MGTSAVVTAAFALLGCGTCPDLGRQDDTKVSYNGVEAAKWLQQGVCNLIVLRPFDPLLVEQALRALQGQNVPPRTKGGFRDGFGVPKKEK